MDAKRCDRCKRFYVVTEDLEKRPSYAGLRVFDIRALSNNLDTIKTFELCADCAKEFMCWIRLGDTDGNSN